MAIAIILFGTQQEYLHFERSLKSLFLCIIAMVIATYVYIYLLIFFSLRVWPGVNRRIMDWARTTWSAHSAKRGRNDVEVSRLPTPASGAFQGWEKSNRWSVWELHDSCFVGALGMLDISHRTSYVSKFKSFHHVSFGLEYELNLLSSIACHDHCQVQVPIASRAYC